MGVCVAVATGVLVFVGSGVFVGTAVLVGAACGGRARRGLVGVRVTKRRDVGVTDGVFVGVNVGDGVFVSVSVAVGVGTN
jgi:hypothetical protein